MLIFYYKYSWVYIYRWYTYSWVFTLNCVDNNFELFLIIYSIFHMFKNATVDLPYMVEQRYENTKITLYTVMLY